MGMRCEEKRKEEREKLCLTDFVSYGLNEIFTINTYYTKIYDVFTLNAFVDILDWLIAARRTGKNFEFRTEGMTIFINNELLIELRLRRKGTIKHQNINPLKKLFSSRSELEAVKREYSKIKKEKSIDDVDERFRKEVQKAVKKNGVARVFKWTENGWRELEEKSPVHGGDIDFRRFSQSFGFSEYFNAFVGQFWEWDKLYAFVFCFEGSDELVARYLTEKV